MILVNGNCQFVFTSFLINLLSLFWIFTCLSFSFFTFHPLHFLPIVSLRFLVFWFLPLFLFSTSFIWSWISLATFTALTFISISRFTKVFELNFSVDPREITIPKKKGWKRRCWLNGNELHSIQWHPAEQGATVLKKMFVIAGSLL